MAHFYNRIISYNCADSQNDIDAIKTNIISAYANVELQEDLSDLYNLIYGTDLYKTICDNVSNIQVKSIIDSVMLCVSVR